MRLVLAASIVALSIHASQHAAAPCLLITSRGAGFFSDFHTAIGALDHFENGHCDGVEIHFGRESLYYDTEMGDNVWEYYFNPIRVGNAAVSGTVIRADSSLLVQFAMHSGFTMPIARANYLIKKYVPVRQDIQNEVAAFAAEHFTGNFIIGVHYRGTDKVTEAPPVPYERVYSEISYILSALRRPRAKIFVASDEENFIAYMKQQFPGRIVHTRAIRSSDLNLGPVHHKPGNGYQKGKEVLLDCLLLSRCNFLLCTASNVGRASKQFVPYLPYKRLNAHVWERP